MSDQPPPPAPPPPPSGYGYPPQGPPPGYGTTPQLAHWIKRVGAYLVDYALVLPLYLVFVVVTVAIGPSQGEQASTGYVVAMVVIYLAILGVIIWNVFIRQGRTGWTVGKQVLGIRLVREADGQPMGAGLCFARQLVHILDSLACYLGWLWPLWDSKNQTFADKLMKTLVIEQRKP